MKIGDCAGEPGTPHHEGYLPRGASQFIAGNALAGGAYRDGRRILARRNVFANFDPRAFRLTLKLQPVFDLLARVQPGSAGMAAQRNQSAGFGMAFDLYPNGNVARIQQYDS